MLREVRPQCSLLGTAIVRAKSTLFCKRGSQSLEMGRDRRRHLLSNPSHAHGALAVRRDRVLARPSDLAQRPARSCPARPLPPPRSFSCSILCVNDTEITLRATKRPFVSLLRPAESPIVNRRTS